ncbi:innexin inx4-like [Clytia hemisphaerica]|uniref:Innexin n=1 Tax=Clytia hemisphaerica TaxID=252671 RepID=A0A7M5UX97_9CNID
MAFMAGSVKSLIEFKIKTRHDGYSDQVSRIMVTKLFIVASLIMGVDWFHDNLSCVHPKDIDVGGEYIESACWIKGFYIYREHEPHHRESGYYGIPNSLSMDGMRPASDRFDDDEFCSTKESNNNKRKYYKTQSTCQKMDKYYFVHYQWMPFYIFSMSALFYMPYILFRMVNTDVISLKLNMKDDEVTCDDIVEFYFNHDVNPVYKMRYRFFMNFVVKVIYLITNISAFYILDELLDYHFQSYGLDWINWSYQNTTLRYDYERRLAPTPGNRMLPSFGMCDLVISRLDVKVDSVDKITVLCEISSNILYQYVFVALWYVLIISISVAALGVIVYLQQHIHVAFFIKNERSSKYVYKLLTFRECQYLEFIRNRDLTMYGIIVKKLRQKHSLPLPKLRKMANKEGGATAPILPNGNTVKVKHHLKHLDSMEDGDSS